MTRQAAGPGRQAIVCPAARAARAVHERMDTMLHRTAPTVRARRPRSPRALLALALLLAAAWAIPAQGQLAPVAPRAEHVRLDVALHHGALLQGGDGANHLRIRLQAERVKLAKRLPLNVVLVIDRSGSMAGEKIRYVREAAKYVVDALQDGDFLSVVSFDNGAEVLQGSAPIQSTDRAQVKRAIDALTDRGGTDMVAGLTRGLEQARANATTERVNRIILLSDGIPDTQRGLVELAASGIDKGIFLTTMGVGQDYNEDLMARLADAGSGNYYFIEKADAAAGIFERELTDLMAAVAREGVVTVETAPGVRVAEVYGFESTPRKDGGVTIPVGDLFGGRDVDILVRLETKTEPSVTKVPVANVRFAYHDAVANRAAVAQASVHQTITTDAAQVQKDTNAEVGAKVVRVSAATAKKEALKLYEQGKRDEAQRVLQSAAREAKAAATAGLVGGAAADETAAELDSLGADIQATPAAAPASKSVLKKARAGARDDLRK
jgi:Ca-activated chloride channel family protein